MRGCGGCFAHLFGGLTGAEVSKSVDFYIKTPELFLQGDADEALASLPRA